MAITGVKVGGQGTFTATPLPPGATLPQGVVPTWQASDPSVQLTPAADGLSTVAAVPAGATITSFDLSVAATLPDGSTPSGKVTVPVLSADVTSFQIDQTA